MKTILKTLTLTFALLVVSSSQAYQTSGSKIEFMRTYADFAVLSLDPNHGNLDNCTSSSASNYVYLDMKNGEGRAMYAAVLSAYLADRRVRFALEGCKTWGSSTIPEAYRVDIYKAQ